MRLLLRPRPACAWARRRMRPLAAAGGPWRSSGSTSDGPPGTSLGDKMRTLSRVQQALERESEPEPAGIEIDPFHQARALGITALHSAAWAGGGAAFAAALLHLPVDSNFLGFAASHPEWSASWVGAHAAYFGIVGLRRGMVHGAESILLRSAWLRQVVDGIGDLRGFSVSSVHEWVAFRVLFEQRLEQWTETVRREGGLAEYFPPVSVTIDRIQHRLGPRLKRGEAVPVADAFHLSLRDLMRDKMDHSRAWGTAMMGGGYLIVVGFLVSVQNFFAA